MGKLSKYDLSSDQAFLSQVSKIFQQYVSAELIGSNSGWAEAAAKLYNKVINSLWEMSTTEFPEKRYVRRSETNVGLHQARERGDCDAYYSNIGQLRYFLARKVDKDYSHPGQYLDEYSIEYENKGGFGWNKGVFSPYQPTFFFTSLFYVNIGTEYADCDYFCIRDKKSFLEVIITKANKIILVYAPDRYKTNEEINPWTHQSVYNIWLKDHGRENNGHLKDIRRVERYLQQYFPAFNVQIPLRSPYNSEGDVINIMMQDLIKDIDSTGWISSPRPINQRIIKVHKKKSIWKRFLDWLDGRS